jgi:hypothetical protein
MDLDWFNEDTSKEATLFNDNSIITNKNVEKSVKVKASIPTTNNSSLRIKKELNVQECFNLNLDDLDRLRLLEVLNYLSYVSNNLRTIIRNNALITDFDSESFKNLMNYLKWLYDACDKIKKHFVSIKRKDLSTDTVLKPFKTSSYKFCNFKNSCSIHKNKTKICDKNHFVFDMVLMDIVKLIESLELITEKDLENINWIFSEKVLKITVNNDPETDLNHVIFERLAIIDNTTDAPNEFNIDKNTIFKCFDVISYVLNKMFEEASTFLNYNIHSLQINI